MAKVNSVVGTILGEATHGTRQQRYSDMVAIASVIANRAAATGKTPDQIVSAPGQFDAYGKALPAGTPAYNSLAEKAWNEVQQKGPVHNATFYATPKATKNLPKGLQEVTSTTGHVYFSDPQNRSIRTAVGYVRPSLEAISNAAIRAVDTVTAPVRSVAANIANSAAALRTAAFQPVTRPSVDIPSVPSVPQNYDLPERPMSPVSYNLGPHRPNPPGQALVSRLQQAVTDTLGPSYGVDVYSGQGEYGSSRHRDPAGIAADIHVVDLATGKRVSDPKAMMDVAQAFSAQGGLGVGYGPEYMGLDAMHLDTAVPVGKQDHEWGSIGNANAGLLADARNSALMPASYYDRNLPSIMSAPPSQTPEALNAAPMGKVDRAPLGPVAPSLPSRPVSPTPDAALASMTAPSVPPAPPSLPSRPISYTPAPTAPAPAPATPFSPPTRPTTPTPSAALAAMNNPAPLAGMAALTDPNLMGPAQTLTPQAPQPTFVPNMPEVPAVPVAPPVAPPIQRPTAPTQGFPSAPQAQPRASAMDVYNGRANEGYANDGSMVSRDAYGNTSVSNKYGATTTMHPNGLASVSYGPRAPSVPSAPTGAISGPLSAPGIPSPPSTGFMGISPPQTETGKVARNVAGSFAGGAIGSLLGPIGSLVGAAIGQSIAQGKNPLDALSRNGLVSFNTPAFGVINAAAPRAGGQFPTAPNRPGALGGTGSNNSRSGMNSISPGAASAISKGQGGLY